MMKISSYRKSPPSLHAMTLIWKTSVSFSFAASPISETDCEKLDFVIQTTSMYLGVLGKLILNTIAMLLPFSFPKFAKRVTN